MAPAIFSARAPIGGANQSTFICAVCSGLNFWIRRDAVGIIVREAVPNLGKEDSGHYLRDLRLIA
jgi:hypothetical protein